MAIVSVFLGGCLGFLSAMFGLAVLNVSWIAALGLWSGVGLIAAAFVLAYAMLPRRRAQSEMSAEHA
jgi:membrane protein implicated in regulation of membrane protease activity